MDRLREVIRKLAFSYLRGPACLLPLLTSNKIKTEARFDHLHRRWELIDFIENRLINYNLPTSGMTLEQPMVLPPANFECNPFNS